MRVIVSNQDPRPATAMATSAPPYFATGEVDGWDGDVIFVSRLPKAKRESVAFRLDDGAFAGGPDLAYVDYWLVDRERLVEWIAGQPMAEKANTKDCYSLQSAKQQDVGIGCGVGGLTNRI